MYAIPRSVSNYVLLCDVNWEKLPNFTEIVNGMMYTGDRKTREVTQRKYIFRQLYGNMLLDTYVMSVCCRNVDGKRE